MLNLELLTSTVDKSNFQIFHPKRIYFDQLFKLGKFNRRQSKNPEKNDYLSLKYERLVIVIHELRKRHIFTSCFP